MVKQLIIAAGGRGTRMQRFNPENSKVLIEHNGKPMIEYLIEWAKESGLKEFFITVNHNNKQRIEEISQKAGIDYITKTTGRTLAHVPWLFRKNLDNQFIMVCGHQPIPPEHFREMIKNAEQYSTVMTAYHNLNNQTEAKKRTLVENIGTPEQTFQMVDLDSEKVPEKHIYLRNPYVLTRDIVEMIAQDDFEHNPGFYPPTIYALRGELGIVQAIMPVEFDFDFQFEKTRKWIDQYLQHKQ